jgi:hypothetical protein
MLKTGRVDRSLVAIREASREERMRVAARLFAPYLQGSVLDVGCDKRQIQEYLAPSTRYFGIDLWGAPTARANLEMGLPVADSAVETVVCFDVLEHLEHCHAVFDELCRVAAKWVIVGLPNVANLKFRLAFLRRGRFPTGKYGLPSERPEDRHRWLFSLSEARHFVASRGARSGLRLDHEAFIYTKPQTFAGRLYYLAAQAGGAGGAEWFAVSWWAVLTREG